MNSLDLRSYLDFAWVAAVEWTGGRHDELADLWAEPWAPVRALWGAGSTQAAGQRAMMELSGGPAPPRDPAQRPPRRRRTPKEAADP